MINQYIINKLIKKSSVKQRLSSEYLLRLKRKASKKFGLPNPTNIEILETCRQMVKSKKIKPNKEIENLLVTKNIRTLSGVAVVAVLTKPYHCPGTCVYCPTEKNMPKSYLSNEPAVMRAILTDFHPYKQVTARLKSLEATGHKTDKIELIVMGGTFSYLPKQYQTWFIKECFRACNNRWFYSPDRAVEPKCKLHRGSTAINRLWNQRLSQLQKANEKSKHRIVGLTLETRPDYINKKEIIRMKKLGATRVELGVQSIYDDVLKLNKRGHTVAITIKATKLLKEAGFKINYHMMPNLPGSNYKRDLEMFKELFSNPGFQPDMLKIYPCVVVKNASIYKWLKTGKYKPYSDKKLIELLAEIKKIIPYYVRITRLIRDIPSTSIIAGNKVSNLRQVLKKKSEEEGWQCKCIRCREVRNKTTLTLPLSQRERGLKLFRQDYDASNGKEIFLSFEDKERKNIYSLLRLRINSQNYSTTVIARSEAMRQSQNLTRLNKQAPHRVWSQHLITPVLKNAAIIREVHTYGRMVPIKSKNKKSPQHTGLGKKLIAEAEKITAEEFGIKKIAVISGVGVRNYYRKLGYRLENEYMVKKLK
ncbi:tRNA uridine(34) 5-carboxymethylaminomethyl modification radical SAM/GNAT enzyme Elp3 [Candidatus Parcubacteria bacterium]|nr:tRNA uridine(34) 5-carboxymethylaminomethyl modification radical SAM/GNAT enzyme Elp3 [Candidatus Parcubacteria bacterium]